MAKILIIEDNTHLSKAYQLILSKEGHEVAETSDGQVGLTRADEFLPEVILLDLLMPNMGGIAFLKKYKAAKHQPEPTIIILSNLNQDKEVQEALRLGAYKYILKADTSPSELAIRVNRLIERL
jgi:twitching motility two-component system response regulator PilH